MLAHVAADGFRGLRDAVQSGADDAGGDARSRLRSGLYGYCSYALAQPGRFGLMFRFDLLDCAEPDFAAASRTAFDQLLGLVTAAQAEGWRADVPPHRLAAVVWAAGHGLVSLWLLGTIQRPAQTAEIDDLVEQMLAIFVPQERSHR
jgi:AcrR family transcriptional regulator